MTKGALMEKKAWTAKGEMLDVDKQVIEAIVGKDPIASRIFTTGEVHERYIGGAASQLLININDILYTNGVSHEPLFTETKSDTIRMTRYDPRFVWRCFDPKLLMELIGEEASRLNVDMNPQGLECYDFYEEMARVLRLKVGNAVPIAYKDSDLDMYHNAVYLSCLLLLGKPGYLDVPVATYFAQPGVEAFMDAADYRKLTEAELRKLKALKEEYRKIRALTNPEMNYIIELYERRK